MIPGTTEPRIAVMACPTADGQEALRWGTSWGGWHDEGVVLCSGMPRPSEGWRAIERARGGKRWLTMKIGGDGLGLTIILRPKVANLDAKAWKPLERHESKP